MPGSAAQQEEHTGVQVSAQGMIYIPFAMVDAVFLEYSDTVILPEDGSALYTFRDERVEILPNYHAENTQRNITAGILPPLFEENLFWPELQGFTVGQEWKSSEGLIHYSFYLPEGYDETKTYPLVVTLPGYNGMWLSDSEQTRGVNLIADRGAVAWTQQGEDVIVVAPQFDDWGNTAARQAIALTEYFIENYSVDRNRIYAAGFSAGGEIMSRVMGMRAELFAAFLHYGSR